MTLPNAISAARLLCVPASVWLILAGRLDLAFWVFVGAGLSDAVDGYVAKRLGQSTTIGRVLDPAADKALLVSVYLTLGVSGYLPAWLVSLVVLRDLLIVAGAMPAIRSGRAVALRPLAISKVNTALQLALAGLVLASRGLGFDDSGSIAGLGYVVAATTLASGFAYLVKRGRRVASAGNPESAP
ncbi:MAG: CDP-alcohol phosphatidyltransferase family protein [Alphaproteobacteria bacterium]